MNAKGKLTSPRTDLVSTLTRSTRSWVMNWAAALLNLAEKIHYKDPSHPIGLRDNLRWCLQRRLFAVFCWAWAGSDEEIELALEGGIPVEYMSARQLAALVHPRSEYGVHCIHCAWHGQWPDCHSDHHCPACGEGVYLDAVRHAF